jgi:hypothetical protein
LQLHFLLQETTTKKLRELQAEFDGGETAETDNYPSERMIHSASTGFEDLN